MISQADLHEYFKTNQSLGLVQKYKKYGSVEARLGQAGEIIITRLAGKKETQNTVNSGDVLIRNPDGEVYPISSGKYSNRYTGPKLTHDYQKVQSKGFAYGCRWLLKSVKFENEQGEPMILEYNDILAKTNLADNSGYYRIEKGAFEKTYVQASN